MSDQFKNLIIVILLLGLGGCLAYIFINKKSVVVEESVVPVQQQVVPENTVQNPEPSTDTTSVVIKEWNLKYPKTEENKDFTYTFKTRASTSNDPLKYLTFTYSPEIKSKGDDCRLPIITVFDEYPDIMPVPSVRKIGSKYYAYEVGISDPCLFTSPSEYDKNVEQERMTRVKIVEKIFNSLVEVK